LETLREIGKRCEADKVQPSCTFADECFLDVYARILPDRDYSIRLLELGVRGGGSLRTWEEYWKRGKIVGVDIDADCAKLKFNTAQVIIGRQDEHAVLDLAVAILDGKPDVIIDDASHVTECTLASFDYLWPRLRSGGRYIIEDTSCTYIEALKAGMQYGRWYKPEMEYVRLSNDRAVFDTWLLGLIKNMDHRRGTIRSILCRHELCVLEKV